MFDFLNHKKITPKKFSRKAGFTLIEMLVAIFVFSIVMTLATGAIFSIVSANKTSQALKSVMDNLSSAIDSMSRDVRYGSVYDCGHQDSATSCPDGDNIFAFVDRLGASVMYKFELDPGTGDSSGYINKCTNGNCARLTAPEVHIKNLYFYVKGAEVHSEGQPLLLITISGYAKAGTATSTFNIETMVSQRNLVCEKLTSDPTLCN